MATKASLATKNGNERREKLLVIKFISVGTLHMPKSMLRIRLSCVLCVCKFVHAKLNPTHTHTRRVVLKWHHFEIKLIQSDTGMNVDMALRVCLWAFVVLQLSRIHPIHSLLAVLQRISSSHFPLSFQSLSKLTNLSFRLKDAIAVVTVSCFA